MQLSAKVSMHLTCSAEGRVKQTLHVTNGDAQVARAAVQHRIAGGLAPPIQRAVRVVKQACRRVQQ